MIYLDNNATTQIAPEVLQAMLPYLKEEYGNASSFHLWGQKARRACDEARSQIAKVLGVAQERQIVFTSGATESNNTAIRAALAKFPERKTIVITAVEHASVLHVSKALEKEGYEIVTVGVHASGGLNLDELRASFSKKPAIISIMWANNETGVVFPIESIAREIKSNGFLLHVDGVQAIGKVPVDLSRIPLDYLSLSAHKCHGPKGIGALFVREGAPFQPLVVGGGQELERRGGTENVAAIVGFGKAMELAYQQLTETKFNIGDLRDLLEEELLDGVPLSFVNGKEEIRIPNTLNMTFPGIEAEPFLIQLSQAGIMASSGSACSTGALEPSHVLQAMGLSKELSSSSIRFSLGRFTTHSEILEAIDLIPKIASKLQEFAKGK